MLPLLTRVFPLLLCSAALSGCQWQSKACTTIQGSAVRDACNLAKILCDDRTAEVWSQVGEKKNWEVDFDIVKKGGSLEGEVSDSQGIGGKFQGIGVKCFPPQS